MATIKEVAKSAGVSVGTVSNVLNGLDTVSEANREKVEDAIKSLNFRPNKIAASLSKKRTGNIGVILPDISSPFYSDLIKGISETFENNGYNIFLSGSNDNIEKETKLINDLMAQWVDGIIIVPVYARETEPSILAECNVPVVLVNREIKGLNLDIVVFNNFAGAYEATNYLIANNHKKIAILSGPKYSRSFEDRFLGWKEAMEEHGLYDESLVFADEYSVESGYRAMKKAFGRLKEIDAVFASSDLIALGAISAIRESGLKIPDEISITGFGDIYLSKYLEPSLTTIKRPFYNIGKTAVSMLMERMTRIKAGEGFGEKPVRIVLEGNLEIRNSVKTRQI